MKKTLLVSVFCSILFACTFTTKRRNDPEDVEKVKKFIVEFHKKMELNEDLTKKVPKWEKESTIDFVTNFREQCGVAENLYFEKVDVLYKETNGIVKWEGLVYGSIKCETGIEVGMEISIEGDSLGLQIRGYNAKTK
jgi:predicted small metal-binding protein